MIAGFGVVSWFKEYIAEPQAELWGSVGGGVKNAAVATGSWTKSYLWDAQKDYYSEHGAEGFAKNFFAVPAFLVGGLAGCGGDSKKEPPKNHLANLSKEPHCSVLTKDYEFSDKTKPVGEDGKTSIDPKEVFFYLNDAAYQTVVDLYSWDLTDNTFINPSNFHYDYLFKKNSTDTEISIGGADNICRVDGKKANQTDQGSIFEGLYKAASVTLDPLFSMGQYFGELGTIVYFGYRAMPSEDPNTGELTSEYLATEYYFNSIKDTFSKLDTIDNEAMVCWYEGTAEERFLNKAVPREFDPVLVSNTRLAVQESDAEKAEDKFGIAMASVNASDQQMVGILTAWRNIRAIKSLPLQADGRLSPEDTKIKERLMDDVAFQFKQILGESCNLPKYVTAMERLAIRNMFPKELEKRRDLVMFILGEYAGAVRIPGSDDVPPPSGEDKYKKCLKEPSPGTKIYNKKNDSCEQCPTGKRGNREYTGRTRNGKTCDSKRIGGPKPPQEPQGGGNMRNPFGD